MRGINFVLHFNVSLQLTLKYKDREAEQHLAKPIHSACDPDRSSLGWDSSLR